MHVQKPMNLLKHGVLALFALTVAAFAIRAEHSGDLKQLHEGDIIFHTSRSAQSLAIQRATGSRYSHMGIILHRNGRPFVLEAISKVQLTPLKHWIERGENGHFVVKRLRNADSLLNKAALTRLRQSGSKYLGLSYDLTFEWSDKKIYCSELVWKMYRDALRLEIGELQKLKEFDLSDPTVQAKIRERYGTKIPLEEPVISPQAMFASEQLATVLSR